MVSYCQSAAHKVPRLYNSFTTGESCVIYTQVNEKKKKYGMSVAMCSRTTRCAFKQELKYVGQGDDIAIV